MATKKQHGRRRAETAPRWNKNIQFQNAGTALVTAGLLLTLATPAIAFGAPTESKAPTSSSEDVVKAASNFLNLASENAVITADPNAKISFSFSKVTSIAGPETIKKEELKAAAAKDAEAAEKAAEIAKEAAEKAAKEAKDNPGLGAASIDMPEHKKDDVDNSNGKSSNGKPTELLSHPMKGSTPSSAFGLRVSPITGASGEFHRGQDYSAPCGTAVTAAAGGTVKYTEWHPYGGGNRVEIDHGKGLVTTYNHLSASQVKVGQKVNRGDVIALSGTTGASTGCHLHFEVEVNKNVVDPASWM